MVISRIRKYLFSFTAVFCIAASICLQVWAGDIAIFGDSQGNESIQRELVKTICIHKPSVIFRVGDIVDDGTDPAQWKAFRDIDGPLLKSTEYYPALGNHERDSGLYFKEFPWVQNKRWYSVDYETIHFIVLDSNSALSTDSEQYKWLVSDLKGVKDTVRFKIILFHHPLFNVGKRHLPDQKKLKDILLPIFRKYRVTAIFSGHDHDYQRFEYASMAFIVTGGGGAGLEDQGRPSPYLLGFAKVYHFCLLSVDGNFIRIQVIDINNKVIDDFRIQ